VDWLCGTFDAACLSQRHFYPGEERGEGFFAALIHKP
jgi:hypothetical protein